MFSPAPGFAGTPPSSAPGFAGTPPSSAPGLTDEDARNIYSNSLELVNFINNHVVKDNLPSDAIQEVQSRVEILERMVRDLSNSGTTLDLSPLSNAINTGKAFTAGSSTAPAPGFAGTPPSTAPGPGTAAPELTDLQALNYIASNNDLITSIGTDIQAAKSHYRDFGFNEGRNLNLFNPSSYLEIYPDLKNVFGSDLDKALKHYIQDGFREGRNVPLAAPGFADPGFAGTPPSSAPGFVDPGLAGTPPSSAPGFTDPQFAGTPPSSAPGPGTAASELTDFQALNYIASNNDLISSIGTDIEAAKSHYRNFGKVEGRALDNFDEWGYLASNNDLLTNFGGNPTEAVKNYISFGQSEGRSTNLFNAESYLNNYADLKNVFGNDHTLAKKHYVESGFMEGRTF